MAPNSSEGTEQTTTSNLTAAEIALGDPLKAETRKARLYLLGVSMVGITIVYTGLVPQQITTLGITFGEADRRSLLFILALVILYFLAAFVVYGGSDFLASRTAFLEVRWADMRAAYQRWEEKQRSMRGIYDAKPLGDYEDEDEDEDIESIVARLDELERRVKEKVAAGSMSKEEAATKVMEEMAQETQRETQRAVQDQKETAQRSVQTQQETSTQAGDKILAAAAKGVPLSKPDPERFEDDMLKQIAEVQESMRIIEEKVAAGLMSKEEAAKDIAVLHRRLRNRVRNRLAHYRKKIDEQVKTVAEVTFEAVLRANPPLELVRSGKAERGLRRYAALSPKMWYIRSLFEFLLPILLGLYAIYTLLTG